MCKAYRNLIKNRSEPKNRPAQISQNIIYVYIEMQEYYRKGIIYNAHVEIGINLNRLARHKNIYVTAKVYRS